MSSSKPSRGQILTSTPLLMGGGLILGILTAVGDHAFASQINGNAVESNELQEWSLSIVTGLAFLTKTFLSASAGLAYTQLLWFSLRSEAFTLAGVDATFSLVNNPWCFLKWELWSNGLSLLCKAIPITAIFTPGTLTAQPSTEPKITLVEHSIPNLNYLAIRQFGQVHLAPDDGYKGPSSGVSRLVATVAAQGARINPPAPYANCSYHLQFYGPSISCGPATSTNASRIIAEIYPQGQAYTKAFVSFVPMDCERVPNETGEAICGLNLTLGASPTAYQGSTEYDTVSQDHARMYVVIPGQTADNLGLLANKTIECGLSNTSYEVGFSSDNFGQRKSAIKSATRLNGVAGDAALSMCYNQNHDASICSPDAYGHISAVQTQVDKTAFMNTKELYPSQYYMNHGLNPHTVPADAMAMTQALEEIFVNATLSLFSSTSFLQNETAALPVPVTIFTPQNKFVYRSRDLFISYTCGVVATAVCVLVGFMCISKASSTAFSASFSTIMRTTRNPDLDALVSPAETSGAEPLDKELAAIRLKLVRQSTALSRTQTGVDTGFDEYSSRRDRTYFADQEDVPSAKMGEKTDPPTFDVDLGSLLAPSEV